MRAVRELLLSLGIVEDTQNFKGTVLGAKRSEKTLKVQLCIGWGPIACFLLLQVTFLLMVQNPFQMERSSSYLTLWPKLSNLLHTLGDQVAVLIFIFLPAQWATDVSL